MFFKKQIQMNYQERVINYKTILNETNINKTMKPWGKQLLKSFVIFFVFNCSNNFAWGQSVKVNTNLDTSFILIGEQTTLRVETSFPEGISVKIPVLSDSISGKIEIVAALKADSVFENGVFRYSKPYLITSFDSGQYYIPPLPFVIVYQSGMEDTLYSYPLEFNVSNQLSDTSSVPYDIKEVMSVPVTITEVLQWSGIGLGLALILALIIYYIVMNRKQKPLFRIEKPKDPPYIAAFRELELIKEEKIWQQGKVKEYYTRLTEVLRTYIENHFDVPALESTTDELFEQLDPLQKKWNFSQIELKQMFQNADLVKFAKYMPLPSENESSWDIAYNFILLTKNIQIHTPATEQQVIED